MIASAITIHSLTLIFVILLWLVLLLILLVLVYGYRNFQILLNGQKWLRLIEEKIRTAILEGASAIENDSLLLKFNRNKEFQKLFLSTLIASDQKFSGDAHKTLTCIFKSFGMEELAWKKLRSKEAYRKVRGIQALSAMRIDAAIPEILELLHHKNPAVYAEAQYATVRFNDFSGLDFLTHLPSAMSEWQQLRMLHAISLVPTSSYNNITLWLQNPNPTVVEFTLDLLRKFGLTYFHDEVLLLLHHENIRIRTLAVKTLQTLEKETTFPLLQNCFSDQDCQVQSAIIKAIKKSKNRESIPFLKEKLVNHTDPTLRITVAETLASMNESNYLHQLLAEMEETDEINPIIHHALGTKR